MKTSDSSRNYILAIFPDFFSLFVFQKLFLMCASRPLQLYLLYTVALLVSTQLYFLWTYPPGGASPVKTIVLQISGAKSLSSPQQV